MHKPTGRRVKVFARNLMMAFSFHLTVLAGVHGQEVTKGTGQDLSARSVFAGYDVISIKPNVSGSGSTHLSSTETTLQASNIAIKMMLASAFGIREGLIFGLPKWAESGRWDINAKVVDPSPELLSRKLNREQSTALYRAQLRSILTDRFHATVHTETKVLPVFDLVVVPGKLLIKPTSADSEHGSMNVHNREMSASGVQLKSLASFLSGLVDRTVIDKTGLSDDYDLELKWSPDELAEAAKETGATDRAPGIYSALQEQLGLKLVPGKGPSDTLVVDSIEPPTED